MRRCSLKIGNIDPANGCVEAQLKYDPLDQFERGLRVWATLKRQDLDNRLRYDSSSVWGCSASPALGFLLLLYALDRGVCNGGHCVLWEGEGGAGVDFTQHIRVVARGRSLAVEEVGVPDDG